MGCLKVFIPRCKWELSTILAMFCICLLVERSAFSCFNVPADWRATEGRRCIWIWSTPWHSFPSILCFNFFFLSICEPRRHNRDSVNNMEGFLRLLKQTDGGVGSGASKMKNLIAGEAGLQNKPLAAGFEWRYAETGISTEREVLMWKSSAQKSNLVIPGSKFRVITPDINKDRKEKIKGTSESSKADSSYLSLASPVAGNGKREQ